MGDATSTPAAGAMSALALATCGCEYAVAPSHGGSGRSRRSRNAAVCPASIRARCASRASTRLLLSGFRLPEMTSSDTAVRWLLGRRRLGWRQFARLPGEEAPLAVLLTPDPEEAQVKLVGLSVGGRFEVSAAGHQHDAGSGFGEI